jgi:amidase
MNTSSESKRTTIDLTAYVTVLDESARERPRRIEEAIEAGENAGPLDDVPVAIKDLYAFKRSVRNTFGCKPLVNLRPDQDATVLAASAGFERERPCQDQYPRTPER